MTTLRNRRSDTEFLVAVRVGKPRRFGKFEDQEVVNNITSCAMVVRGAWRQGRAIA